MIKLVCGVGNNASWPVVLEALDHAKQCRRYNNQRVRHEFAAVLKMYKRYERNLIYSAHNRFFCIDYMSEDVRKRYKNITDREYYEFWVGTGTYAYNKTRPLITSLWNKYRVSLVRHHIDEAEHKAWVMTANAVLQLACLLFEESIKDALVSSKLPKVVLHQVFGQFSFAALAKRWDDAMKMLAPELDYPITETENKNIIIGIDQLSEAWLSSDILYRSLQTAVEDYDDVFVNEAEHRKAAKDIEDTIIELRQMTE